MGRSVQPQRGIWNYSRFQTQQVWAGAEGTLLTHLNKLGTGGGNFVRMVCQFTEDVTVLPPKLGC